MVNIDEVGMQYCPKCKKMSMMYVHGLKEAFCINKECRIGMKFETYDDCKKVLKEKEKTSRKGVILGRQKVVETRLLNLEDLAKEIHEEFSRASRVHGIIEDEDYAPYEDLPINLKDALMDLAVYIDKIYVRRRE
jgi:hypothetical protein